jgi:MerR family transcriptional regulator, heat shock protein HspR
VRDGYGRDPGRPVYVISVAAGIVHVHPRTLRIYEEEGLVCPARTPSNIRLYSEDDIRRVLWIRHLTQNLGVNLAGVRILFEIEKRMGTRILETLFTEPGSFPEDDSADMGNEPKQPKAPVATPSRRA